MLKRSIFSILTGLLHSHLIYIINLHEHLGCFMQLYNRMTPHVLLSRNPVTLCEHRGHSNWNQNVQFSSIKHHTKFEINRVASALTNYDVVRIFHKITSADFSPLNVTCARRQKISMSFNKLTGCGNILNLT